MTDDKRKDEQTPRLDKENSTSTGTTSAQEDELAALRSRIAALEVLLAANVAERREDDRSRRRSDSRSDRHHHHYYRSRRRRRRHRDDDRDDDRRVDDSIRDLSDRSIDEGNKVMRAMAMAWMEQFRTAADAVAEMAEEVYDRNRADNRDSFNDLMMTWPRDFLSGCVSAMDRAMDIPGDAIDRYNESYDEADELEEEDRDRDDDDYDSSRSYRLHRRHDRRRDDRRDDRRGTVRTRLSDDRKSATVKIET